MDGTTILVGAGSPILVAIGTAIGNWRAGKSRKHRLEEEEGAAAAEKEKEDRARTLAEEQAERDRDLAHMMDTMMELVWAVRGKDKTMWEPARKGLIQLVNEHGEKDERIQNNLIEVTEDLKTRVVSLELKVANK